MRVLLDLLEFLTPYGTHSLVVIFAILLACGFGLPMPEDIILISAGILASHNVFDQTSAHIVCFAGVMIGDGIIYTMGLKLGPQLKRRRPFNKILTPERDAKVTEVFRKYGTKVIFMARFMPGLRMPIFLTSGIFQVKWWVFLALDGIAALISVPLWVHLGYIFGAELETLEKMTRRFQVGIYSILALVIAAFLIILWLRHRKNKAAEVQPIHDK
ncbi:MAG: hypothetical protein RIQ81_1569 [Pseudomonadota bacterium]|jgi:membrane protein DedA with SNARE-associated domain